MPIATTNPATGEVLKTYEAMSPSSSTTPSSAADLAFRQLRRTTVAQRARWMNAAADLLDAERDEIARMMTTEMGKTLAAAQAEVGQVRQGAALLRRARRGVPRRRAGRRRRR